MAAVEEYIVYYQRGTVEAALHIKTKNLNCDCLTQNWIEVCRDSVLLEKNMDPTLLMYNLWFEFVADQTRMCRGDVVTVVGRYFMAKGDGAFVEMNLGYSHPCGCEI